MLYTNFVQNSTENIQNVWKTAQKWELNWHSDCINSFNEERKQFVYAEKMGLRISPTLKTPFNFDLNSKSVLDIGGGAYSLLLKCTNFNDSYVADPLMGSYPAWVLTRYETAGINVITASGETLNFNPKIHDEVWLYNVLEHTYNPELIISNALALGKVIRIFEWVDTEINIGHPQVLTEELLNKWLKGEGKVEFVNQNGAVGKAYFGVFKGNSYEQI